LKFLFRKNRPRKKIEKIGLEARGLKNEENNQKGEKKIDKKN